MTVEVREDEIIERVYKSNHDFVSVEAKINRELNPVELFQLTEDEAGNRFYFKKNNNQLSFFGFNALKRYKNDFENKQSIFREWEKDKERIDCIHPHSAKHHLKICGGFQFSAHKSGDEWRQFGINHFILPEILSTMEDGVTYVTYTVPREEFDIERFKAIVQRLTERPESSIEPPKDITRIEDIFKDEWRDLVAQTVDELDETKKIVLARRRLIQFEQPISVTYLLQRALTGEQNSYLFVLESEESIFFSQTPEQLIEVEDNVLSTKAVAGTIRRTHDEQLDEENIQAFLNDQKNLNEHQFVVDSILQDIEDYVTEVDYNRKPEILTNDHLYHLYTQIKASLKENAYIKLLDRLHPTPALGGYPKDEAVEYIERYEFGTRGLYGAPVGYIDMDDDCEFIVAIRSMLLKQYQAILFAGCGIVCNSDADAEVAETSVKFKPMMKALGVEVND
ncbi:isochorismate synthase [Staphylococcus pettenkoferi]|uniref:isochorismate synthase n=1 Tax=Staphylococcus pettenkoferi TaxID=170573 RepID=UPI00066E5B69|nr:isochorismate synthase [Staphylococcus pettenkoferi]MDK7114193.1 isochorismate synthase [Staphylococcus pettenkoferi]MDK7282872.1 isochorismate synthase [Staphylococcus pettenkoferi]